MVLRLAMVSLNVSLGTILMASSPLDPRTVSGLGSGQVKAAPSLLQEYYEGPQGAEESNHWFDMWEGTMLVKYARHAGLTNNHALMIHAHSRGAFMSDTLRQALYPHESRCPPTQKIPWFGVRDMAEFLGPERSANIHNIVLSTCNLAGEFNASEWRSYFINTTNLIHVPSGQAAFQPMLTQVLYLPSHRIEPIFERSVPTHPGEVMFYLEREPASDGLRMEPFVAELFLPGMAQPYRRQLAGRELLWSQPECSDWSRSSVASLGKQDPPGD